MVKKVDKTDKAETGMGAIFKNSKANYTLAIAFVVIVAIIFFINQ